MASYLVGLAARQHYINQGNNPLRIIDTLRVDYMA